ncbi:MAG TPA: helix-turn-helix domain-containing protein [Blastocatellia bacterium]|nr:helix-turn-helix domain-containing protein [Blastocatellia bacterium]
MNQQPEQKTPKNWWGSVWRGLVVDSRARHYQTMRGALWLFLYLVIHADRRTGTLIRRCRTVAGEMGMPLSTVRRWLSTLRRQGYVTTRRTGRSVVIHIEKWKPITAGAKVTKNKP